LKLTARSMRPKQSKATKAKQARAKAKARDANVVRVSVERGAAAAGLTAAGLKKRAERMLDALDLQGVELSVALVGDGTIRDLNAEWRKKDKATDVLSFPMLDDATAFATSRRAEGARLLGDVIIATPTATRQAKARKATLADEIGVLLSHGVLHLLGFDHGTDDEEREMNAYAGVLAAAGVSRLPMRLKLVPVARRTGA
jgi:probable rRNA maturation factor